MQLLIKCVLRVMAINLMITYFSILLTIASTFLDSSKNFSVDMVSSNSVSIVMPMTMIILSLLLYLFSNRIALSIIGNKNVGNPLLVQEKIDTSKIVQMGIILISISTLIEACSGIASGVLYTTQREVTSGIVDSNALKSLMITPVSKLIVVSILMVFSNPISKKLIE